MKQPIPDKSVLHKMNYYSNQENIALRYLRENDNWNTHLSNTKRIILSSVKKFKPPVVTLLGSGWLLDIPVEELLMHTPRIRLVDLVHPPDIVRKFTGDESVVVVKDDISGGLPALAWSLANGREKPKQEEIFRSMELLDYEPQEEQGLVISVNLLSQLASLPFEFLLKRKIVTNDMFPPFASKVQEKHLAFLKRNSALLITDYEEVYSDRNGKTTNSMAVMCKLPQGKKREEWTWHFDSKGSYNQGGKTSMRVAAIQF